MKRYILLICLIAQICTAISCSRGEPSSDLVENINSMFMDSYFSPERVENSEISYAEWLEDLKCDLVVAKDLASNVEKYQDDIKRFRTIDAYYYPRGHFLQGKDVLFDCVEKAALGDTLDKYMSIIASLLYLREAYRSIPEPQRKQNYSVDTVYVSKYIRIAADEVCCICDDGLQKLKVSEEILAKRKKN